MEDKIVIFGAGKIGRSFIGQLFSAGGFEIIFVDIASSLVEILNARKKYEVVIKSTYDKIIIVNNVSAIDARNRDLIAKEVTEARILAVSVGKNALPAIFPLLAYGIEKRYNINMDNGIDIIIAENMLDASSYFNRELMRCLPTGFPINKFVGLVETSIGKMVPIVPQKLVEEDPLRVYAESYNTLILDKQAFLKPIPEVEGLAPKNNIKAWVDRKLFIHNLGHAATAYWGYYNNPHLKYIWEALNVPIVYKQVRETMLEACDLLERKYPNEFTKVELINHVDDLIERFQNKELGDTIYRVGCDLTRKLSENDRLAGAVKLAVRFNLPYDNILKTLIVGCHFRARDDEGRLHPNDEAFIEIYNKGVSSVLTLVCGFNGEKYLHILVEGQKIEEKLLH